MARYFKKFWRRGRKSQGPFGGRIASHEEVRQLNKKIVAHEEKAMEAFEEKFDEELRKL